MTTKAEKLARELIALSERYSQRDFDGAAELLLSGKLFTQAVQLARTARSQVQATKRKSTNLRRTTEWSDENDAAQTTDLTSPSQLDFDYLHCEIDEADRNDLFSFAKRFQTREILTNGSSVRLFAQQLGIQLPKSLPGRPVLLKTILRTLCDIPQEDRATLLREADRIGNGESSLQRWSDLIVKPDIR